VSTLGFCGVRMMQAVQLEIVRSGLDRETAAGLVDGTASNPVVDLAAPGHTGTIVSHAVLLVALAWLAIAFSRDHEL